MRCYTVKQTVMNEIVKFYSLTYYWSYSDSKVPVTNMVPTWVLSVPDGPHVDPMNLAIRYITVDNIESSKDYDFSSILA